MKLLIFDTETTSVRPGNICQLTYILIDASKKPQVTTGKNFFFTVDDMEEGAEAVHGFSLEKLYELSEGRDFLDRVHEFMPDFFEADFIIGHNVQFDIKFLKHEVNQLWEAGMVDETWEPKNHFCTMNFFKSFCNLKGPNGLVKNPKLSELMDCLNITEDQIKQKSTELFNGSGNYHDARFDTTATYLSVIQGMKKGIIKPGYFSNILKKQ